MRRTVASILVIDDDASLREFVREVLAGEGYDLREACDGTEGLEAQRQRPADLILCDLFMPGKEGLETIRELHDQFPQVRVIAMSGGNPRFGSVDFLPMARKLGASAALHKPLEPRVLVAAVRDGLRERFPSE